VPLLGGILDPLTGVFTHLSRFVWRPELPARADSPERRRRGLCVVVGGIEGPSRYSWAIGVGMLRAGYRGAVTRSDWGRGIPLVSSFRNLASCVHHERESDALARTVIEYYGQYRRPAVLIAQSGGCWIVVRALEKLPAEVQVDFALLLAPSISPQRDLSLAAARCRRGLATIRAPGDFFFLGLGTSLLGTSDRVHGPAAGLVGWQRPARGVIDLCWRPEWIRHGYLGNHTTSCAASFVAELVRLRWPTPGNDAPLP